MACSQKTKTEPGMIKVSNVILEEDNVEPPPDNLTSKFKTTQEWLFSICDEEKPEKSIANYEFRVYESSDARIIYIVGINKYHKGDTSISSIVFEPKNMYFPLPKSEYKNLNRDQWLDKLTIQLRAITSTVKFKTSFLSKANTIVFKPNGQTIWSKR